MGGELVGLVFVVILGTALYFFISARTVLNEARQCVESMDDEGFLRWLQEYEGWYTLASKRLNDWLFVTRITPLFIGFIVALISAAQESQLPIKNYLVIGLTGISTLCVAVLTQLRLAELARAREIGRINLAQLVARTRLYFSMPRSPDEALSEKQKVQAEVFKIEHDQAALFASLTEPPTGPNKGAARRVPLGSTSPSMPRS
jgi:hypothetical protein